MVSAGRRTLPPEENYDGYIQLENGVGMIPLLESEFDQCLADELEDGTDGFDQDMDSEAIDGFESIKTQNENLNESEVDLRENRIVLKLVENKSLDEPETENKTYRRVVSIATGKSAAGLMRRLAAKFMKQHPDIKVIVYQIRNDFLER